MSTEEGRREEGFVGKSSFALAALVDLVICFLIILLAGDIDDAYRDLAERGHEIPEITLFALKWAQWSPLPVVLVGVLSVTVGLRLFGQKHLASAILSLATIVFVLAMVAFSLPLFGLAAGR
jgi:hypothetical protein